MHALSLELTPFSEIAERYDVIFFDAYGVLKNANGVLAGVPELLMRLRNAGKHLFVITNDASKSPERMAMSFSHPIEGELIPPNHIISSGLLAGDFLAAQVKAKQGRARAAYLGKPGSAYYIESAGLEAVPLADWPEGEVPAAICLLGDEGFDWFRDINRAVNLIRECHAPVVIGNADLVYPTGDGKVALAVGSLGGMLETIARKRFFRFGKPDALMFMYAMQAVRALKPGVKPEQILMVGDTLDTDILGASRAGLDTALVLSGNTLPTQAAVEMRASGLRPSWVAESILG